MKPWFRSRETEVIPADRVDMLDAYKDGRRDERKRVERDFGDPARAVDKADVKEAYERGRRDERARHRGSPLAAILVVIVAIAGAGALYLAAREGSFSAGGQVVDANLSAAADKVQAPVRNAADSAGNALENAGQNIKQTAGSTPAAEPAAKP